MFKYLADDNLVIAIVSPSTCCGATMPKTAGKIQIRRTTSVPVTTMEELPVLSDKERADLRVSLKQAEQRIASGTGIEFKSAGFKQRLLDIYRGVKR